MRRTGKSPPPTMGTVVLSSMNVMHSPRSQSKEWSSRGAAALFSPEPKQILHRAVRRTEQHPFGCGLVGEPRPARRHENIARLPADDGIAHKRLPFAFHASV